jgi:hypothetical protein
MGLLEDKLQGAFAAITRGMAGVKLGPGVLGTIVPINTIGLVAIAAIAYALSANPLYALIGLGLGLAFLAYANDRAFRYAEKNPIPALFSGGEIIQLFREQHAARDQTVVVEAPPVMGANIAAIERGNERNA